MVQWCESGVMRMTDTENGASGTAAKATAGADHKIPSFKVPIFYGDTLKGDKYIDEVANIFRNNAMAKFVDSVEYCDNHSNWSEAFASRLRDSISESDILGYLATELNTENNCAKVWRVIKEKLSSADVTTVRMYH